jgi:hypothetical protein
MRRFPVRIPARTGAIAAAVTSAAALTALATAALAGAATNTATTTAARSAASARHCTAADLGVWIPPNQGNGAAGTIYYPLEFTNLSHSTCSMYGFPGVSAINSNGHQLGVPATWPGGTRHTVTLAPGATAHATLAYHDAVIGSYPPANHAQAFELRIYPPGQRSTQEAYWPLTALTNRVPYLSVGPIQPGVGTINTS